jgi:hypothetical protein
MYLQSCNYIEFHRLPISTYQGKTFYFYGFRGKKNKRRSRLFSPFLNEGKFSQKKNVLKQSLMLISFEPEEICATINCARWQYLEAGTYSSFFCFFFSKNSSSPFFFFQKKNGQDNFFLKGSEKSD